MRIMTLVALFLFIACSSSKGNGKGKGELENSRVTFMPENQLFLEDDTSKEVNANGIDEAYFNSIIEKAQDIYAPIVSSHGGILTISGDWQDSTVNAYADRQGNNWSVQMFGGMARRNEITKDGFALIICHELGHHLAGYPFYVGQWAGNEGNSDFYATAGCAAKLFGDETPNPSPSPEPTPQPNPPCPFAPEADATPCKGFSFGADATTCQRAIDGSLSLGKLLAALGGEKVPSINTPDRTVVSKTQDKHPKAQCRLDTMYQGVLCTKVWNDSIIPQNKADMANVSCSARPACWYKP